MAQSPVCQSSDRNPGNWLLGARLALRQTAGRTSGTAKIQDSSRKADFSGPIQIGGTCGCSAFDGRPKVPLILRTRRGVDNVSP